MADGHRRAGPGRGGLPGLTGARRALGSPALLARRRPLVAPLLAAQGLLLAGAGYLLALLAAAATARRARPPVTAAAAEPDAVVLIPAHDEELVIERTLRSCAALDYPPGRATVVVIADNCTDATADLAARAGADVYVRDDPSRRGKGQALAWALERLFAERPGVEVVVVVDADCEVSPNLLRAIATRVRAGARAVQTDYVVANPDESRAAALRFAGFALVNTVRPLGKSRLGLSCGLYGTGMAFTRDLLREHPWEAFSIIEDAEYHLRLVSAGERVAFAPEAAVRSPMPVTLDAGRDQQARWEGGKVQLARAWTPRLVAGGARARSLERVLAGLELLLPPQSLLAAGQLGLAALGRTRAGLVLAAAGLLAQAAYVLGGLVVVRAPVSVYRALALAPVLIARKVALYARLLTRGGPTAFVRTAREPAP